MLLACCMRPRSQVVHQPASVPYLVASPLSPVFADPFTAAHLPAALPYNNKGLTAGLYLENRFGIKGLNLADMVLTYRGADAGMSARLRYFGNASFNQSVFSLQYGRSLGTVSLGSSFSFEHISLPGYISEWLLEAELSSLWQLSEKLFLGLSLSNPHAAPFLGGRRVRPGWGYRFALGNQLSENLYWGVTMAKRENEPLDVNGSFQYRFADAFAARAGLSSQNAQPFFGAGWQWSHFRLDLAVVIHAELGASPGILFIHQPPAQNDVP